MNRGARRAIAALLGLALPVGMVGPVAADERSGPLTPAEVLALAERMAADMTGDGQDPADPASSAVPIAAAQLQQEPDGTVRAGQESTVVAADLGIEVTFSGNEVPDDLDIRIDALLGAVPATAGDVAVGSGLPAEARTLVEPFEVVAHTADGAERTSFPTRVTTTPREGEDKPETDDVVEPGVVLHVPVDPARSAAVDAGTVRLYTRETADEPWVQVASYLDADTGVLYGELDHLSQFVVIGVPAEPDPGPRIVLDPDNDVALTVSPSGKVTELPFTIDLATRTAALFATRCRADVLVTRVDPRQTTLSQQVRAGMAASFDPDATLTLAFDAAEGHPWGTETSGGSKTYPGDGAASAAAGASIAAELPGYTGRPSRVLGSTLLPYDELRELPGAVVHLEALYLDHNYDWPVVRDGMPHVADGVFTGLGMYLETQGFDCTDPSTGGWPARPSADELERWRQIGHHNHQVYGADPVSFSTGNLVEDESLFSLAGPAGSALDIELTYNSQDGRPGRVGAGWTFGLGARAQRFDDGGVLVVRGDGASFLYEPDGAGGFVGDVGNPSTLREVGDGRIEQSDPDGTRRVFDTSDAEGIGELVQITDRAGATTTLAYGEPDGDDAFVPLAAITDPAGQVVQVQSDAAARISAFVLPDGRTWALGYDPAGDLVTITAPDGRVRSFTYDAAHRMTTATDAAGVTYLRNAYDDAGRVVEQWDAEGTRRAWQFTDTPDDDGLRSVVYTDNEGRPATYRFDDRYRVVEAVDTLGRTEQFDYDQADRVVRFTDAAGGVTEYGYDGAGNITSETTPDGAVVRRTYDAFGSLTSMTDQGGEGGADRTTSWGHDVQGRVTSVTEADGAVSTSEYDAAGNLVAETDPAGGVTRYEYDAHGNRVASIDPLGIRSTATYDATNRLVSTTDGTGATTTYSWDAGDRLIAQTDPLGAVTDIEYDALDHPVRLVDPVGAVTTLTWDALFRITSVTDPTGAVTRYTYSTEDALLTETDPTGAVTTYERDAADQVTAVIDPLGGRWERTYDALGHVLTSSTPSGAFTTSTYDAAGRQTSVTDATGATRAVAYDTVGRAIVQTDPYGATTRLEYDLLDRVIRTTDPAGETETFGYDAAGRLVSTTDRTGQTWRSEIDAAGQVIATTDPLGAITRYTYDAAGRVAAITDALGAVTTYGYDAAGRAVSTTDPLGATRVTTYDAAGRIVALTDATGATSAQAYDLAGRLIAATDALGAVTGYQYDSAGRQTATVDPMGTRTDYTYDLAGQLVSVVEAATAGTGLDPVDPVTTRYGYDLDGHLTEITDGRGGSTAFTHDAAGRVLTETDATGRTWTAEYDAGGRLAAQVDARGLRTTYRYDVRSDLVEIAPIGGDATTFTYDAAQRRIAMTDGLGATAWGYDEVGRLVHQLDTQGQTLDYTYDAVGQVTALTMQGDRTVASTFDAAGRMTAQRTPWGGLAYAWDAEHRLTTVSRTEADGTAGITTTAAYDAAGRPVSIAHVTPVAAGGAGAAPTPAALLPWRAVVPEGAPVASPGAGGTATAAVTCSTAAGYLDGRTVPEAADAPRCTAAADYLGARTLLDPVPVAAGGDGLRLDYRYDDGGNVTERTRTIGRVAAAGIDGAEPSGPGAVERTTSTYDALSRLTRSTSSDGIVADYGYDATGNRTSWTSTGPGHDVAWRSTFDAANHLTSAEVTDGALRAEIAYTLDGNGSRLAATATGDTLLTRTLSMQAEYGSDGRVTAWTAGGATTRYGYDGLGRAVTTATSESTGTVSSTWTFDGLVPVAGTTASGADVTLVRDALGSVALQADDRLTGTTDGAVRWDLVDALGSVVAQASAASGTASITQLTSYDDYGTADQQTGGWASATGYSGQMADLATGSVPYHQRMYDPLSGTWASPDAWRGLLDTPLTLNRFAFVLGDPVSMVDLLGFVGNPMIDGMWGSTRAAGVGDAARRRTIPYGPPVPDLSRIAGLLPALRSPDDPSQPEYQYSANGPRRQGTGTVRKPRSPQANQSARHSGAIEASIGGCVLLCLSVAGGYEFGTGWYINPAFGIGPEVGWSPAIGYRNNPQPGWGTDLACTAALGPVGVEGSLPYGNPAEGGSGLMYSPGAEFGCAVMTGYTYQW